MKRLLRVLWGAAGLFLAAVSVAACTVSGDPVAEVPADGLHRVVQVPEEFNACEWITDEVLLEARLDRERENNAYTDVAPIAWPVCGWYGLPDVSWRDYGHSVVIHNPPHTLEEMRGHDRLENFRDGRVNDRAILVADHVVRAERKCVFLVPVPQGTVLLAFIGSVRSTLHTSDDVRTTCEVLMEHAEVIERVLPR